MLSLWQKAFRLRLDLVRSEECETREALEWEALAASRAEIKEEVKDVKVNWKGKLMELYARKLARPLEKGELEYNTEELEDKSFVSTVRCLNFAAGPFVGEPCRNKRLAEQAAARVALNMEFPDVDPMATVPKRKKKERGKEAKSEPDEELEWSK